MKVPVFCYGSYMDPQVLHRFGATPGTPVRAALPGWRLTFTPHANLVPDAAATTEGFVFRMAHDELDKLYGPQGYVTTYKPVPVLVETPAGHHAATTFVEDAPEQAPDVAYLGGFLKICQGLGLPAAYIDAVKVHGEALQPTPA